MEQQKNFNPFEVWKDFYNKTSNMIDDNVKDESTSKVMGQVLEMNLLYKKLLNETTERYFEQVNIPTRNDLASISSLIINVDSKVDDLEELIEGTQSNQVNQAELKREMTDVKNKMKSLEELKREMTDVKGKMKGLDAKLNQIITLLKTDTTDKTDKTDKTENNKKTEEVQQEQLSNQQ